MSYHVSDYLSIAMFCYVGEYLIIWEWKSKIKIMLFDKPQI